MGLARKRSTPGRLGEDLGGRQRAAALQRQQLRGAPTHEPAELGLEARALARELTDRAHQLARDPHPDRLLQPREAAPDALEPAEMIEHSGSVCSMPASMNAPC